MTRSQRLFSERNECLVLSWNIPDLSLSPLVRERIVMTMASHNDAINRGLAAANAKVDFPRAGARHLWRPFVRMLIEGPLDQVFDVLETVWDVLPEQTRREFSGRINRLFEEAELPWRLRRGNIRFLYLIYERSGAD